MSCDVCVDGLLIQAWTDAPHDFAICLCDAGQVYRKAENEGHPTVPLWRVWCAREQVDPARVFLLEDIYSAAELAVVGLSQPPGAMNREAALLAAGKRRAKR